MVGAFCGAAQPPSRSEQPSRLGPAPLDGRNPLRDAITGTGALTDRTPTLSLLSNGELEMPNGREN
jgi:hypothetical protein